MLSTRRQMMLAGLGAAIAVAWTGASVAQDYPDGPVRVIVPFGAGGGTDTLTRTMQPYLEEELGVDLVVVNTPGAGSVTGSRSVIGSDPDGQTVLINHASLLTNIAVGKADFSLDKYEIAASTTSIPLTVAVPASSPIDTLADLEAALGGSDPVIVGANIGAVSHFAMLMIEDRMDASGFRYVLTGGGAATTAALLGEQIAVAVVSGPEAKPLMESGEIKVIAALSGEEIDYLPGVPTAAEQGIDVEFSIEHSWYFPAGTSDEVLSTFSDALARVMEDPELLAALEKRGITPTHYGPEEAAGRVADTLEAMQSAAALIGN